MKKLTQEEYVKRVYERYGDEYTVLGEYTKGHGLILIRHNTCGTEFEVDAFNFADGKSRCPLCTKGSNNITHDIFVKRVYNEVGNEYSVLGNYESATSKLKMRHNKCSHPSGFYDWDTTAHNFMDGGKRCPYCAHQTDEFKHEKKSVNPNIKRIGKYTNSSTKTEYLCLKENHVFMMSPSAERAGNGCPYCSNHKVLKGFNDIWTTHPHIAELLEDEEFGYTHTYGTTEKTYFRCPDCNNRLYTLPSLVYNKANEVVCPQCKDGFSYPEKFMCSVLNQLGINYTYQLTSRDYDWIGSYRYDFYLDNYNYIIEVHGLQHYERPMGHFKNYKSQQEIDKEKLELALANGIKKYFEIDCRYSELEWIKNNIISSDLSVFFDLSVIDWKQCALYASKSLLVKVCDAWNNGNDTIKGLQTEFGLSDVTVARYLDKGTEIGLCCFNHEEYVSRIRSENWKKCEKLQAICKPVYCHELNEALPSMAEAKRKYHAYRLDEVCGNPNRTSGGYHWSFVSQLSDEFKKLNNIK